MKKTQYRSNSKNDLPGTSNTQYRVRVLRSTEIDDALISAWADLEARAMIPNAFLSPYFVVPAIKHLEISSDILGVFVEKTQGGYSSLIGVAIFKVKKPTRQFPLVHLAAFESIHSYLSGFLIDKDHANDARNKIYEFITSGEHPWHGLYINNGSPEDFLTEEANITSSDFGMKWTTLSSWQRAVFHTTDQNNDVISSLSKHLKKNYKRSIRNLQELGKLEWKYIREKNLLDQSADEFIRLEHMGWKGEEGTSIYSDSRHINFFKEMVHGFGRENRAFFAELSLNERVISSTSNLTSGNVGFAFKVGWDTHFAKYAPGVVNEIQLLEHKNDALNGLKFIDSSASPDSYISRIWTGRRTIVEGIFTLTNTGRLALSSIQTLRKIKTSLLAR